MCIQPENGEPGYIKSINGKIFRDSVEGRSRDGPEVTRWEFEGPFPSKFQLLNEVLVMEQKIMDQEKFAP
jgi:hypothetical protein